ncbi:hypothetical protein POM88_032851 [Heracleum sosnowskyi]|uniref:F-box domain-containing protein n=1 Tax=Heracleum sosnowskyi TaxID=360622 RepID=A0AAD8I0Z5_9APIA|nr:hypothetical protein POM88_032851 [Heracleum sosnowskyi]
MDDHDWQNLPTRLLSVVASRLQFSVDVPSLSAVCKSWNDAASTLKKVPMLLLAEHRMDFYPSRIRSPRIDSYAVLALYFSILYTVPIQCLHYRSVNIGLPGVSGERLNQTGVSLENKPKRTKPGTKSNIPIQNKERSSIVP